MNPPVRWHPSAPWPRVWPVAAVVIAVHALFLHGWQLADGRLQPAAPTVSTMVVRLLTPSPAVPEAPLPPVVPEARAEPTTRDAEPPRATAGRAPRSATSGDETVVERRAAASSRTTPEPEYLAASRLDPGPKLLDDVEPAYPPEAGVTEGRVVLRLLIGATGAVDEVTVVRAAPSGVFDRAAIAAFSAARFSPGRMLGVPVKSQITIEVHFTPIDRGANVAAPTY